jgi:hypothetical protein
MLPYAGVGTHDRYKALRPVFYNQLNGVILVHELANGRWVMIATPDEAWADHTRRSHGYSAKPLDHRLAPTVLVHCTTLLRPAATDVHPHVSRSRQL